MDDLINKKVLLREMTKLYNERKVEATMTGNRACGATWDDAVLLVVLAPAVVTEPKDCKKCKSHMAFLMTKMAYDERTAKWVSKSGSIYLYCSGCGREKIIDSDDWNFCPNCGAKMDLDRGENDSNRKKACADI